MALENILSQEIIQKLGWTLLHFIWQATAVALLLTILLALLRKAAANVRYIVACAALGLIVLLPIVTIQLVPVSTPQPIAGIEPTPAPVIMSAQEIRVIPAVEMTIPEAPVQHEITGTVYKASWKQRAAEKLEPALPYIVAGWLLGVFGLSLWHLGGWAQLQCLRKKMVKQVDDSLHTKLRRLSERLRVKRAVQLVESALVQVPTVVGWLRPVILLPASALTGLSSEQLEAILAHELAHIRRHDYLINMLQTLVETLGFYHPAVWWVSHKIRIERENCCDDLAVSISGDRVSYARALTSMEEIRGRRNELAVAAAGGNLFGRIRRLVGKDSTESSRTSWVPSVITILLIAIIVIPTTLALTANEKKPTADFILNKSKNKQPENEPPNDEKIDSSTKVLIETQIIHVNNEFLKQIGLDTASLKNSNTWTQYRVDNSSKPFMFAIDSSKKDMLLKTIEESEDSPSISRIFMMTMSGQEAIIKNNSGYDFKSQELGRFIKIKPESSQNGRKVNINCELMMRQFKNLDLFFDVYINKKVDQNDVSESEIVEFQTNAGNILLPDDHTLLILSGKLVSFRDVENGTPILRNIPVIGEFFNTISKIKVEKNEIILIKTTIVPAEQSDDVDSKASSYNVAKIFGSKAKANELLQIYLDLHLEAGQYVEIKDRGERESTLKQVPTGDIGKSSKDFPAYAGYIDFEIRSNFDLNLETERYTRGSFFKHDKWDAYFTGPDTIIGNGYFSPTTLCVSTWRVKLYEMGRPDDDILASLVAVIIKPNNKQQEKSDVEVESDEGRIEGRIIDINTGKGISSVQLAVVPHSSPELSERFVCTSAEDGSFAIGGLQSGEYLLQGDFPSVDVDVVSGRCTNDVLIGVRRGETVPAPKETTAEQQGDGQIMISIRMIEIPANAMKDIFEPNESLSSGLLVRHGHEIAGRLLTLTQERKDAKLIANPNIIMMNNTNTVMTMVKEEVYTGGYESVEGEPGKLTAQNKFLEVGWKFKIKAEILESGEKVHIELATRQQEPGFETLQYRPGYDYQIPSPPEIFVTEVTAKNGEPFVIARLRPGEPASCLIVTPSALMPEEKPEPLLGKKLPEPGNIQNIDGIKQAEGKRILVCFWDMNQRPSRNLIAELAEQEKELAEKDVAVVLVDTSQEEPTKLKQWLDSRKIPFACGNIEGDAKKVLFRWGVRAQPWLILTDQQGVVRAEGFGFEQLDEKLQVEESVANNSSVPMLAKSAAPSGVNKSVVKVDLSVVEVPPDSKMDRETIITIRNLLAGKITLPDSPATADLLRKAAEATAAVEDESAGDKRVTQKQFDTLFDTLVSRGYVKILMNPTLEVVDGQTAKVRSTQDSIQITPNVLEDGNIILQVEATFSSLSVSQNKKQTPIISKREISTRVRGSDGESLIIGMKRIEKGTEADSNAKDSQEQTTEVLLILTPTIVAQVAEPRKQPQPVTETKEPTADKPITRVYDISDLVHVGARISRGIVDGTMGGSDGMLGSQVNIPDQAIVNEAQNIVNLIMQTIDPNSWYENDPNAKGIISPFPPARPRKLAIYQTLPAHQQILKFLESRREQTDTAQISIELRYLYTNVEFLDEVRDSMDIEFKSDTFLDDKQLETLLRASLKKRDIRSLMAPGVTVLNNETARLNTVRQSFMSFLGYSEPNNVSQPSTPVPVDTFCRITPHIEDNKNIIIDFVQDIPGLQERIIYDRREMVQSYTETTAITNKRIPNNKTFAFICEIIKFDQDNQTASPAEKKTLIVLIKPTIIVQEEMPRSEAAATILNSQRTKGYTAEQSDETILLKPAKEEQPGTGKTQIMIDTKILNVDEDFLIDIGLDANSISDANAISDPNAWPEHAPVVLAPPDNLRTYRLILDDLQVAFLLKATQAHKDAKMLSSPRVTVQDGEKAELFIGQEIPYVSGYNEPNSTSDKPTPKIEELKTGTSIWLRPRLTPDKENVYLDFKSEVIQILGFKERTYLDKYTHKFPLIKKVTIGMDRLIPLGKTLLVGGLKITEEVERVSRTPWLGDLPLIGRLFSNPGTIKKQRMLLILVKPTIDPQKIAQAMRMPTLQPLDSNDPLIKKLEEKFKR